MDNLQKKIDYLNDRIVPLIYKTFIPMVLASSVSIVTQLANTFFMGHEHKDALYIVGLYIPFSFFMTALIEGFQISNASTVAFEKGKDNLNNISKIINNLLLYGIISSLIIAIFISLVIPQLINFFNVHDGAINTFLKYTRLMVFMTVFSVINAILLSSIRGYGLVKISSGISVLASLSNIILVYIFINFFNLGVYSIVLANFIVISISIFFSAYFLLKYKIFNFTSYFFSLKNMKLEKIVKIKILNIGIPVAISYFLIFISTFFFNKILMPFGNEVIAGFGAAYRLQTIVLLVSISFGNTLGLIMNQNMGGNNAERAFQVYKKGLINIVGIYIIIGMVIFLGRDLIASFLIADGEVSAHTENYLQIVALSYSIMGPMMSSLLVLEQIGKGLRAFFLNFLYFFLIVVVGWLLTTIYQVESLFYWTISLVNTFAIIGIFYSYVVIKNNFKMKKT
ncbi:MATE family efflux transporter [Lysinibacillus capsici]|uniref:MATE family efflux transporter n=2 Tax=Lysinibacillus TaxID=400634 RepID=UPI0029DE6A3A|nr:MATE family efflux transporter [Lysinibacillus capsici]WPK05542.1 MATE family efflux transporter [Lysinibacillus capsici]